jgi:Flp pilus assembly protein TadB
MRRFKRFLAVLGFTLAAVGVALDQRLLVWAAMIVLGAALGLRLWLRRRGAASEPPGPA